jgi:hypothetical protein
LTDGPDPGGVLRQVRDGVDLAFAPETVDRYSAAADLAMRYRLPPLEALHLLEIAYPGESALPAGDVDALAGQIEAQTRRYEVQQETVEIALALVKPGGFERGLDENGVETYTAEISYPVDREALLARWEAWRDEAGGFGFHYDPYVFDSSPERSFFAQLLGALQLHPGQVEDVYFTGGIGDPQKTDFFIEYRGEDGGWHRYTPDFVIRRRDGRCLIVEIKKAHDREHPVDGERGAKAMAMRAWTGLNPDRLQYEIVFTGADEVGYDQTRTARRFINEELD